MNMYINKIRRSIGFDYERNAALRLVLTLGGFYIALQALYIIILVLSKDQSIVLNQVYLPQVTLQTLPVLVQKPCILVSHMIFHIGFWEFITNMVWLYLFSNVIQTLVGYREIVPLYVISALVAALGFTAVQELLPLEGPLFLAGSYPAILAMGVAAMILAPAYRVYIAERFSFPLWAAFAVYLVLNLLIFIPHNTKMIVWMAIGGLTGAAYMLSLKNGFSVGRMLYRVKHGITGGGRQQERDSRHQSASRQLTNKKNGEIDAILEKIHQKGMLSLTPGEKETLEQYSRGL